MISRTQRDPTEDKTHTKATHTNAATTRASPPLRLLALASIAPLSLSLSCIYFSALSHTLLASFHDQNKQLRSQPIYSCCRGSQRSIENASVPLHEFQRDGATKRSV